MEALLGSMQRKLTEERWIQNKIRGRLHGGFLAALQNLLLHITYENLLLINTKVGGWVLGPSSYLVPVPRLSVSVRGRGRARAWSFPVSPAGLLAPGLLLGPTLASFLPLWRADCTLTLAGVTSNLVVWSGSIPEKQCKHQTDNCDTPTNFLLLTKSDCVITPPGVAVELLTCLVCLGARSVCGEDLRSPVLLLLKK